MIKLEITPSNRSRCNECKSIIPKGTLRIYVQHSGKLCARCFNKQYVSLTNNPNAITEEVVVLKENAGLKKYENEYKKGTLIKYNNNNYYGIVDHIEYDKYNGEFRLWCYFGYDGSKALCSSRSYIRLKECAVTNLTGKKEIREARKLRNLPDSWKTPNYYNVIKGDYLKVLPYQNGDIFYTNTMKMSIGKKLKVTKVKKDCVELLFDGNLWDYNWNCVELVKEKETKLLEVNLDF